VDDLWSLLPLESQNRVSDQVAREAPDVSAGRQVALRNILARYEHRRIGIAMLTACVWAPGAQQVAP
jgi:hypothetical protein